MKRAIELTDDLERMKLVTASLIGGLQNGKMKAMALRPLNPILGETCQRIAEDGTLYFAEQISHHPPITFFEMKGPNNCWRIEMKCEFAVGLTGGRHLLAHKLGTVHLHLKHPSSETQTHYTISGGSV